tara:strand:+ start:722 stop:1009 length:288 start_codon:yes stop_codon:yes gene_type:complete
MNKHCLNITYSKEFEDAINHMINDAAAFLRSSDPIYSNDCTTEKNNLTGNSNSKDTNPHWPSCTACAFGKELKEDYDEKVKIIRTTLNITDKETK